MYGKRSGWRVWGAAWMVLLFFMGRAMGQEILPEGEGLAAQYPGDVGIAKDTAVLLVEGFEEGGIADLEKRWSSVSNKNRKVLAFAQDVPVKGAGERSLRMRANKGQDTGGHLYTRLKREVDVVFARFYVKFPEKANYIHHFVHIGGYCPSTSWPQGGAGVLPEGDKRFTVGVEPFGYNGRYPAPGAWNLYAYWHEMKASAGNKYWGNGLQGVESPRVPAGKWQCMEVMLKCNTEPSRADGELALWVDGKLVAHFKPGARRGPWTGMGFKLLKDGGEPFEGFRWRNDKRLKVNFFWLLHYVTESAADRNGVAPPEVNDVWFDHIVVAERYIGPAKPPTGP